MSKYTFFFAADTQLWTDAGEDVFRAIQNISTRLDMESLPGRRFPSEAAILAGQSVQNPLAVIMGVFAYRPENA